MRERRKEDLLMFVIMLPLACAGVIFLLIGAKDRETHQERQQQDTVLVDRDTVLVTLEDSVHCFEDGM